MILPGSPYQQVIDDINPGDTYVFLELEGSGYMFHFRRFPKDTLASTLLEAQMLGAMRGRRVRTVTGAVLRRMLEEIYLSHHEEARSL